jgi:hypothetical protein
MNYGAKRLFPTVLGLLLFANIVYGQSSEEGLQNGPTCGQVKEVRDPLIDEADRNHFNTRYVEIAGSTYTRDREFRKRMVDGMSEGDIFSRKALEVSVKKVAKMRSIYPITMNNVEIRLDRENRIIDIVICVKQKPKR